MTTHTPAPAARRTSPAPLQFSLALQAAGYIATTGTIAPRSTAIRTLRSAFYVHTKITAQGTVVLGHGIETGPCATLACALWQWAVRVLFCWRDRVLMRSHMPGLTSVELTLHTAWARAILHTRADHTAQMLAEAETTHRLCIAEQARRAGRRTP